MAYYTHSYFPMSFRKPKCRWTKWSLLILPPVLLLAGISIAWIILRDKVRTQAEQASIAEEQAAVKAVLALGGKVMYENQYCAKDPPPYRGRVWCVDLTDTMATDASLDFLAKMPELLDLRLDGTNITDAGLERLKGVKRLALLYLARTKITDVGVDTLVGLPHLFFLNIGNTCITDQAINKLRRKCYIAPYDVGGPPQ